MKILRLLLLLVCCCSFAVESAEAKPRRRAKTTATTKTTKTTTAKRKSASTSSGTTTAPSSSQKRTSSEVQSQRKAAQQALNKTTQRISLTDKQIKERLGRLTSYEASLRTGEATAENLRKRLNQLDDSTNLIQDSIAVNEQQLSHLRDLYVKAVRSSRRNRREMSPLTFIFSADNFRQAYRRMRYLEQYSRWRKHKAEEITAVVTRLQAQREQIEAITRQTTSLRSQELQNNRRLRVGRDSVQSIVKSLQGEKQKLSKLLGEQQQTLRNLDREIERLIQQEAEEQRRKEEEERRRAAEAAKQQAAAAATSVAEAAGSASTTSKTSAPKKSAKPTEEPKFEKVSTPIADATGKFESRRGQLPSPLSHSYIIARPFGVQTHKAHSHVTINNPGVDLETAADAVARCVHPGTVTGIFIQEGYEHVVLVRHGSYLTVYANVKSLRVRKGDSLQAGDAIGTVGPATNNESHGMLHFEIRRERDKFDPAQWLRH